MSTEKLKKAIVKSNEPFVVRKKQLVDLAKNNELKDVRLEANYVEEVLKHNWLIHSYIAKYGYISEDAPENTLKAYNNAIEKNYPILITVQMLDDGEIVCFSHKTISSVTKESGYITKMSLKEIKELNLQDTEEKIPTLDEALEFIAGKVPVIVEFFNVFI